MKNTLQNTTKFSNLLEFQKAFPDEKACRDHLAKMRWNGFPVCVHCGSKRKIYSIKEGKILTCADCRKQFTVRVGTIFEDSALPLQKWFFAIYIFTAHKKGISSIQLSKDIGVTQKTAWFMLHRIRHAVRTQSLETPLTGVIEVDEMYVGGKPRFHKRYWDGDYSNKGRGTEKTPVFGMKQRDGVVRAQVVDNVKKKTLQGIIKKDVSRNAIIMTDEWGGYEGLRDEFAAHQQVRHGKREYVRGNVHTNSIESFWALFKRGHIGIYHMMSKKHLDKYIDEFEFRVNSKDITDPERMSLMLGNSDGRLRYNELVSK